MIVSHRFVSCQLAAFTAICQGINFHSHSPLLTFYHLTITFTFFFFCRSVHLVVLSFLPHTIFPSRLTSGHTGVFVLRSLCVFVSVFSGCPEGLIISIFCLLFIVYNAELLSLPTRRCAENGWSCSGCGSRGAAAGRLGSPPHHRTPADWSAAN